MESYLDITSDLNSLEERAFSVIEVRVCICLCVCLCVYVCVYICMHVCTLLLVFIPTCNTFFTECRHPYPYNGVKWI